MSSTTLVPAQLNQSTHFSTLLFKQGATSCKEDGTVALGDESHQDIPTLPNVDIDVSSNADQVSLANFFPLKPTFCLQKLKWGFSLYQSTLHLVRCQEWLP